MRRLFAASQHLWGDGAHRKTALGECRRKVSDEAADAIRHSPFERSEIAGGDVLRRRDVECNLRYTAVPVTRGTGASTPWGEVSEPRGTMSTAVEQQGIRCQAVDFLRTDPDQAGPVVWVSRHFVPEPR